MKRLKTHPIRVRFFRLNRSAFSYSRANDYDGLAVCRRKEWLEMTSQVTDIYENIAQRTDGNIYIGVVGPVRTGKSTFIKRFMQTQILPRMENGFKRDRAIDELPQSGSGRTIMTAEPKFVPEEAAHIRMADGVEFGVRLVDCVGYLVPGAMGQFEDLAPRMVMTPWFDHEIPMAEAAEIGTRKVISEHATVGIVITTDGTITEIPREDYLEAEDRAVRELQSIGKPFVILLNSAEPDSPEATALADELGEKYGARCLAVNCLQLSEREIQNIIQGLLYEFPLQELALYFPSWVDALPEDHPIRKAMVELAAKCGADLTHMRQVGSIPQQLESSDLIEQAKMLQMDLGVGSASVRMEPPRKLFYDTVGKETGFSVQNDGDLMTLLSELSKIKAEYDKVAPALQEAYRTGYGIVLPGLDELALADPEIIRQGGRYSLKMRASAPSIHMIRADIETTVSPIVGDEKQSEDMVNYLLQQYEGDTNKLWQSNIFGRSFNEIVGDDLQSKLKRMPEPAQKKMREALERIINEGGGGLICIIL